MDKSDRIKAYLAGVCFSVLVGFSFYAIKICVPIASTLQILVFRFNFAFLGVAAPAVTRLAVLEIRGKTYRALLWSAALYIGFMILQAIGLIFSTSIESAILFAIIPIIAKIAARLLLGERATWRQNAFVGLSVAALIYMITRSADGVDANLTGIFVLTLSSVALAVSNVLMRYVRKEYKPYSISIAFSAIGFVCFNLAYVAALLKMTGSLGGYFAPCAHPEFVLATAYLGIACIGMTTYLMSFMIARIEAVRATIFGNLSTAISIIAGVVLLKEALASYQIFCVIAIIAGVVGVNATGKKVG